MFLRIPYLNYIYYVRHFCIYLYNNNNLKLYDDTLLLLVYLFSKFFLQMWQFTWFRYDSDSSFINGIIFFFSKFIIFIAFSLKNSRNFVIQSLSLYTSCSFSIPLNVHIVDIEYPRRVYSPTFVVDNFSGLFLHPSIFF